MFHRRSVAALAALLTFASCADQTPVALDSPDPSAISAAKGGPPQAKVEGRASLLVQRDVEGTLANGAEFAGELTVTEFGLDQTTRTLTIDGVLTWVQDGRLVAQVLDDVPATLSRGGASGQQIGIQSGHQETGACDILFLEIPGGVFLDLLGLQVDLAPVELDLDAVRGANALLGNLLCAVTGLLDGVGSLAGLLNLLDRVNDLLEDFLGLGDLLNNIPLTGALPGGGTFSGLLDITGFGFENGELVVSGLLEGTVTRVVNGVQVVTQISQAFEDLPATLSDILGGVGAQQIGIMSGHEESGVCDVLFLEIPGGVFLDLLGLQVDLAPVELDIDAASGANALLGNLLCALTGLLSLLTELPALIGQIGDLIDTINDFLDLINDL